jgi:HEAT repeat protein
MSTDSNYQVNQWLEMLRSPEVGDRLVAVKSLQHLGEDLAIEGLITALKDESTAVQKIAVSALWELGNPQAVPALLEHLGDWDPEVRIEALSALGELISSHHLSLLLDALGKENVNLQLNILILLRKIHDIGSVDAVLSFFNSQHPELREAAVTTLRYLNQVQICPKALSLLNDDDNSVRRATAITLGYLKDGKIPGLLSQSISHDSDWQVRKNAAISLVNHANSVAVSTLKNGITDENWQVRKSIIQLLQKAPQIELLPLLIESLRSDQYSDVRKEAAIALSHLTIGHPSSLEALDALKTGLNDEDTEVQICCQKAIEKIESNVKQRSTASKPDVSTVDG